jgi:hypothetical protein
MNRNIRRLAIIFVGVFAILVVAVGVLQYGWLSPEKRCKAQNKWWEGGQRVCAQPVLTSDITGRLITDDKARAEAEAAVGRKSAPPKP